MSIHNESTLLARIDERTAHILEMLKQHLEDDERVQSDLETRMRKQERFRNLILGAAAIATGGGGSLVTYLFN